MKRNYILLNIILLTFLSFLNMLQPPGVVEKDAVRQLDEYNEAVSWKKNLEKSKVLDQSFRKCVKKRGMRERSPEISYESAVGLDPPSDSEEIASPDKNVGKASSGSNMDVFQSPPSSSRFCSSKSPRFEVTPTRPARKQLPFSKAGPSTSTANLSKHDDVHLPDDFGEDDEDVAMNVPDPTTYRSYRSMVDGFGSPNNSGRVGSGDLERFNVLESPTNAQLISCGVPGAYEFQANWNALKDVEAKAIPYLEKEVSDSSFLL